MEISTETDSDLGQSEPWTMIEDSDIEVCDEPSKAKEVSVEKESTVQNEEEEEDDFAKLQKHRKFIEQLEVTEDLSWDPSDIASEATRVPEETAASKTVCTRCSICSVLLTKGGSKLAPYICNTFLALCVLALASGAAYYFQFPNQLNTSSIKNVLVRYTQPVYAVRYDKSYIEPKYEKNKQMYYKEGNKYSNNKKYEDTTRKHEKKIKKQRHYENRDDYKQREYKKEYKEKKRYNKNDLNEKRYSKKDNEKKAYKQEYKESKQRKNSKSKVDYKRK